MNGSAFSALGQVTKRVFRPWLELKWIRMFTDYDEKINHFQKKSDDVIKGVSINVSVDSNRKRPFINIRFVQIIQRTIDEGFSNDSFVDKLIGISRENPDFTLDDIKVEAHSLLIGVNENEIS